MLKNIGENDNIIYGDLSKQLNFKCDFKGKNNIVFFAGRSKNINIIFHSDNNLVFIGNGVKVNGTIFLLQKTVVAISMMIVVLVGLVCVFMRLKILLSVKIVCFHGVYGLVRATITL